MENSSGSSDLGPLAAAADECLVFDLEGRLVAANSAALSALGSTIDDLAGRRAWELCTCLTAGGFERALEAMRSEGPQSLLGHLRLRDGGLLATDTRLWIAPYKGRTAVFALAREMRGCQSVVEERDQLALLVEDSSELVILLDRDLRVSYANASALQCLGFERPEDIQGVSLHELIVPDQRAQVEESVVPRLERGAWDGELELRSWREATRRTPCWIHAFVVRNSRTRKPVGFALTARDVTARRSAEERRSRLLRLAETSRTVAMSLLEDDDLNRAVFEILSGVAAVVGASRAHLDRLREDGRWIARTHEWVRDQGTRHRKDAPAEAPEKYAWAAGLRERGEALRIDDTLPLQGTGAHPALPPGARALLALPVFIHGQLESVFTFTCDQVHAWEDDEVAAVQLIVDSFARGVERQIAERDKTQARIELEQAVEREKVASRYKSEFLASMSHELRTPMSAIRGYAELLARPHPERSLQETWIRNLRRSTEYLLGLIHDVLDLSKIEAGHMRLEPERASLSEVLLGVHELLAATAQEKCLDFQVTIAGEVPAFFLTDPVRLKQILVNLAGNAIKFTERGTVTVSARQKGGAHEGRTLEISVSDTGIGIPAEAIDKLFRPFSQVSQRSGGTGLGLQISRCLARLLKGDIAVQSEVGKGSRFVLELPLDGAEGSLRSLPERSTAAPARALPSALRGRRILVVDDSLENREVLRFLLQEAGATTECAINGQAGIERAIGAHEARIPFDAILMDMNMPIVDGFEATRAIVRAGVKSPIIALTALALAGDEQQCREAGCSAYVGKPIVPSVFFEVLSKHLLGGGEARGAHPGAQAEGQVFSMASHPRFRGLVERYVASFPELVSRLRSLATRGEFEEVRTLVHRLRGTAASYGFPGVSAAAGHCEDAIRAGLAREELARRLDDLLGRLTLAATG